MIFGGRSHLFKETPHTVLCFLCSLFPESTEVTCKQPVCGARSGLPRQLWLSAQRGESSGRSPGERQPDAHLQMHECWNHQRLNQPQPSTSLTSLLSFTLLLYYSCLLLRVTYTQHRRTVTVRASCLKGVYHNNTILLFWPVNTYTEQRPDWAVVKK